MTDKKLPESVISRFNEWRESGQSYKDPRDFVEGWHKDRLFWFISEELAQAKTEERERIIEIIEGMKQSLLHDVNWAEGYNQGLDTLLSFLKNH